MKKILVPCDFSGPSVQAFRFAVQLATAGKGEIYLLNVVEIPVLHTSVLVPVQSYEKAYIKGITEKANVQFGKLKVKWAKKIPVHFLVLQGPVVHTIDQLVARKKIEAIVMGTHGANGMREFTIGSNTEKIVRTSPVPVFAIKKTPDRPVKDIIFPTSLQETPKAFIEAIKELQRFFKAKLHLLYINTPENFNQDIFTVRQMNEFVKHYKLKPSSVNIFNDRDEEDGIIHFSLQFRAGIIAMATHGRKGIGHLLSGSIAEDIVNHIECPIWTYAQK